MVDRIFEIGDLLHVNTHGTESYGCYIEITSKGYNDAVFLTVIVKSNGKTTRPVNHKQTFTLKWLEYCTIHVDRTIGLTPYEVW